MEGKRQKAKTEDLSGVFGRWVWVPSTFTFIEIIMMQQIKGASHRNISQKKNFIKSSRKRFIYFLLILQFTIHAAYYIFNRFLVLGFFVNPIVINNGTQGFNA